MNASNRLGLGLSLVVMFGVAGVAAFSASPADADAGGDFGALAHSKRIHRHGGASHQLTQDKADEIALRRCGGREKGCEIVLNLQNQCGAYAEGKHNIHFGVGSGGSKGEAKKAALKACKDNGGEHCTIRVHTCTKDKEVTEVAAPATADPAPTEGPAPDPQPAQPAPDDTASPDAGT